MFILLFSCYADNGSILVEGDLPWIDPESAVYDYTVTYKEDGTVKKITGDFSFTIYTPIDCTKAAVHTSFGYRTEPPPDKSIRYFRATTLTDSVVDGKVRYTTHRDVGTYFYAVCRLDESTVGSSNIIGNIDYVEPGLITSVGAITNNSPHVTIEGNNILVTTDHSITIQIYDLNGSCIKSMNVSENCYIPLDTFDSKLSIIRVFDNNEVISTSKVLAR
jgi:hypothetical protein